MQNANDKYKKRFVEQNVILADIAVVILIIVINFFLFRGNALHGMEFDEVYRLNNLFPLFHNDVYPYNQSICSLNVGGVSIPLMYKEYISSAFLITAIPVVFFHNTLKALRCIYLINTIAVEVLLFFFLKKNNWLIAVTSTFSILVCPLLFPYIRFGWAYLTYGFFLIAGISFALLFTSQRKRVFLLFSAFFFAFLANVYFYSLWIIGGLVAAMVLFYPIKTIRFCKDWRNMLFSFIGVLIGGFNYLYYNVAKGFPSFITLFNYLFKMDSYNERPIDGSITNSLLNSFDVKLKSYEQCIGPYKEVYLTLLICLFLINIFSAVAILNGKQFQKKKGLFIPLTATIFSFALMLISPNSQGSHHLTFIVLYLGVTIGVSFWLLASELGVKKKFVLLIAFAVFAINLFQCNKSVTHDIISNGNGYFTEEIFDLVDYVQTDSNLSDSNLKFIEWGFSSQFYYINGGRFKLDDITFGIRNKTDIEREEYLKSFFNRLDEEVIYVPVYYNDIQLNNDIQLIGAGLENFPILYDDYTKVDYSRESFNIYDLGRVHAPVQAFIRYIWNNNGEISVLKYFDDDDGPDIVLLRISDIDKIKYTSLLSSLSLNNDKVHSSFSKYDHYEYLIGLYDYENSSNIRWAQKKSAIFLKRGNHNHLSIKFWAPLIDKRDEPETELCITVNGETVFNDFITEPAIYGLYIDIDRLGIPLDVNGVAEIDFSINSKVLSENDMRELGLCIEEIGFID